MLMVYSQIGVSKTIENRHSKIDIPLPGSVLANTRTF